MRAQTMYRRLFSQCELGFTLVSLRIPRCRTQLNSAVSTCPVFCLLQYVQTVCSVQPRGCLQILLPWFPSLVFRPSLSVYHTVQYIYNSDLDPIRTWIHPTVQYSIYTIGTWIQFGRGSNQSHRKKPSEPCQCAICRSTHAQTSAYYCSADLQYPQTTP
jgi:hypothetical protein